MIELSFHLESAVAATVLAHHGDYLVGSLSIYDLDTDPFIDGIHVQRDWRRQGIATAMWHYAKDHCPDLSHSRERTPVGQVWAQSLGQDLPRATIIDPRRYGYDDVLLEPSSETVVARSAASV